VFLAIARQFRLGIRAVNPHFSDGAYSAVSALLPDLRQLTGRLCLWPVNLLNTTDTRTAAAEFEVFAHLQADNLFLYRRVLSVFVQAQQRFTIALRPSDVCDALQTETTEVTSAAQVLDALAQLTRWGNLDATQDTADVNTVEEFYRARFLYQLSAAGEAAEGALQYFAHNIGQRGELKAAALRDILQHLEKLQIALLHPDELDEALAHHVLKALVERFQELTSRAQIFLRTVQRPLELHQLEAETFLRFKTQLIEYLERFISELVVAMNQIAERILLLDELGIQRALTLATAHDLADDILRRRKCARTKRLNGVGVGRDYAIGLSARPSAARRRNYSVRGPAPPSPRFSLRWRASTTAAPPASTAQRGRTRCNQSCGRCTRRVENPP
jgi:Protein of unknown function (DUF2397)